MIFKTLKNISKFSQLLVDYLQFFMALDNYRLLVDSLKLKFLSLRIPILVIKDV